MGSWRADLERSAGNGVCRRWLERAREAGGPRREPRLGARGVVDAKLTEAGAAPPSFSFCKNLRACGAP